MWYCVHCRHIKNILFDVLKKRIDHKGIRCNTLLAIRDMGESYTHTAQYSYHAYDCLCCTCNCFRVPAFFSFSFLDGMFD